MTRRERQNMVGHAAVIETAVANASAPIVKSSGSTFKFVLIVVGVIAIVGVMGLGSLVYVGYRVKKKADEYIQTSSTSARDTCAECTNHGYRNVKQLHSTPVPPLRPGDSHTFRAEMNGGQVRVFVDNAVVWDGTLGPDALSFDGPVGIRSDNTRLEMELHASESSSTQPNPETGCRSGASESE